MKAHVIWFIVAVAALVIGMQFSRREVRIVEKPVEVVKIKEVIVERPVVPAKVVSKGEERSVAQKMAAPAVEKVSAPLVDKRNSVEQRARMHRRYDPFLKRHGLTPAQMDRFVELKLSIYEAQDDLQAAVEQNGVQGGTADVEAMRRQLTTPMWDEIKQLLGSEGYRALGDYEGTSAIRPTVDGVFRAAGVSVSEEQADQVARLMVKNMTTYREKPTDIGTRMTIDWNAVARDAESLLTPEQLEALKRRAAHEASRGQR